MVGILAQMQEPRTCYKVVYARRYPELKRSKARELISVSTRSPEHTVTYLPNVRVEFKNPGFVFGGHETAMAFFSDCRKENIQVWEAETHTEPFYPEYISAYWSEISSYWEYFKRGIYMPCWSTRPPLGTQIVNDIQLLERIV